jgi:hypothetical protein
MRPISGLEAHVCTVTSLTQHNTPLFSPPKKSQAAPEGSASASDDDGLDDSASSSNCDDDDEEPGCASIFTLHHLTEASFESLVQRVWPGEFESAIAAQQSGGSDGNGERDGSPNSSPEAQLAAAGAAPAAVPTLTGRSGRRLRAPAVPQQVLDIIAAGGGLASLAGLDAAAGRGGGGAPRPANAGPAPKPHLLPAEWWVQHLGDASRAEDADQDALVDLRVLRWVYGNIISSQSDDFAVRQSGLRGGQDRGPALALLLDKLAACWRRLQRQHDRRRQLEDLRLRVKAAFAKVRELEQVGLHCSPEAASAFLAALFGNLRQADGEPGAGGGAADEAAVAASADVAAAGLPAVAANKGADGDGAADSDGGGGARDQDGGVATGGAKPGACSSLPGGGTLPPPPSLRLPPLASGLASPASPPSAAADISAGALQRRVSQLAPLYQCAPAAAVVFASPELALSCSQDYALALLERELAVLALSEAMLSDDTEAARARAGAAGERRARQRVELGAAEAEHARLVADGPAAHRKRDALDKATKEAEHREKAADALARVEASKGMIAADEAEAAAAAAALSEAAAQLVRVREQARQIAARRKNLRDLNLQLELPLGPDAIATATATATAGDGGGDSSAAAPAGTAVVGPGDAALSPHTQRLECLMYRVLWASESVKLFRSQYSPHGAPSRQYQLLVRASKWARARIAEHEASSRALEDEQADLHGKLQDLGW